MREKVRDYPLLARGSDVARPVIYGLVDPREPTRVRYVGKSEAPAARLGHHVAFCRQAPPPVQSKREAWIRGLLAAGVIPDMVLLQYTDCAERANLEREWILRLQAEGDADLNGKLPKFATSNATLLVGGVVGYASLPVCGRAGIGGSHG